MAIVNSSSAGFTAAQSKGKNKGKQDQSGSPLTGKESNIGHKIETNKRSSTIDYVDPNTDPSLLTREMRAQLYKQNDSPRKHAESIVKDYAFLNGLGESTLPSLGDNIGRPALETVIGEFGQQTVASTLKTSSLFKNHMHKHID